LNFPNRSISFKFEIQTCSNFDWSKIDLLELEKFGEKYGFQDLEKMNNFLNKNLFRFGRDLKWKFREFSRFKIQLNLI
jgi:hypothetical protein